MIARLTPGDSPDGTYSLNYDATSFVVTKTPDSPNQNVVDPGDPLTFTNGSDKLYLWGKTEDAGNVALGLAAGNKGPSYFITEPAKAVVTEGRIIGATLQDQGRRLAGCDGGRSSRTSNRAKRQSRAGRRRPQMSAEKISR